MAKVDVAISEVDIKSVVWLKAVGKVLYRLSKLTEHETPVMIRRSQLFAKKAWDGLLRILEQEGVIPEGDKPITDIRQILMVGLILEFLYWNWWKEVGKGIGLPPDSETRIEDEEGTFLAG